MEIKPVVSRVIRDITLCFREGTANWGTCNHVIAENAYDLPQDCTGYTIVDVGANIGSFTILAAKRGAMVYAFEPLPESYKMLRMNVILNDVEDKVKAFPFAVGEPGKARLYITLDRPDWCSLDLSLNNLKEEEFVEVDVISLEQVFQMTGLEHITFLKLDCEGAEREILKEVADRYHSQITWIAGEFHYGVLETLGQLKRLEPHFSVIKKNSDWEYKLGHL